MSGRHASDMTKDERTRETENLQWEETKKAYEQYEDLKSQGHTCLGMLESFPPQLMWCRQTVCEKNL